MATDEYEEMKRKQDADRQKQPSLYMFSYTGNFRMYVMKVVSHRYFESFMMIFIIISTVQLSNDNPLLDSQSNGSKALYGLDKVTSIIFLLEAIAKIIGFGLYSCGSTSYLRSSWNILDIVIVFVSFISLGLP